MNIVVIGAGVVGLTTALALREEGHAVTLVERREGAGLETSFGNGGQLSYCYVAPLASPGVLADLPSFLLRRDSPVRFRPAADPHQWRWLASFLRACTARQSAYATRRLLALSALSRELLHALLLRAPLSFDFARNGKLVVYSTPAGFAKAKAQMALQRDLGCEQEALDRDGCLAAEPALSGLAHRIVGGILTPGEEAGDCHRFCLGLLDLLRRGENPVRLLFGTEVRALRLAAGRVRAVETAQGPLAADAVVLAAGAAARTIARTAGLRLPIYPLKGYSLTLPLTEPERAPRLSVTDYDRRIVYARLGSRLRVAGMADIVGDDAAPDPARIALLRAEAAAAFPGVAGARDCETWTGLRPATPTGMPILGPSPVAGLFLNVGHGALGFTMAMGAARVVADTVAGRPPAITLDGFRLADHR